MKFSIEKLNKLMAGVIVVQLLAISAMAQAEEVDVAGVSDTAIAVDVIVNIDKDDQLPPMPDEKFGGKIELNFYGFMGGHTSQWQPANLARNTTHIYPV